MYLKNNYMKTFCIKKPGMTNKEINKVLEEISMHEFGKNIFNPISNYYLKV